MNDIALNELKKKLHWHMRRGSAENEWFLQRLWQRLPVHEWETLLQLLENVSDQELWDWITQKSTPPTPYRAWFTLQGTSKNL